MLLMLAADAHPNMAISGGQFQAELDFLMRYKGLRKPVECKATTGNAKSMRAVLKHPEKHHVTSALKLGNYNIGRSNELLTLPIYMAFLLTEV